MWRYRLHAFARDPDSSRAPNAAYVSRDRCEGIIPDGYADFAPDLVVECTADSPATWSPYPWQIKRATSRQSASNKHPELLQSTLGATHTIA